MKHIFIEYPVDGYLSDFSVLAIMNHAAMNIGVHVFFLIELHKLFVYFAN